MWWQSFIMHAGNHWWTLLSRMLSNFVKDAVQLPCLELNKMSLQHLDKLQTLLCKFQNSLDTNSCSVSFVQSFLELVGHLTHICIFPSKLLSIIDVPLPNLCHYVLSCQYDGLSILCGGFDMSWQTNSRKDQTYESLHEFVSSKFKNFSNIVCNSSKCCHCILFSSKYGN